MALNSLILHRFNGDEEFRLGDATIRAHQTENGIRIDLEAPTEGAPVKSCPDTSAEPANPSACVAFVVSTLDMIRLVGSRIEVPAKSGEDECEASFYYYEHEDLENNTIDFLERSGKFFRVRWTANTIDVNFYDDSKPKTKVEIEGWFAFEKIEDWDSEGSSP